MKLAELGRRERQIVEALYRLGGGSVADVRQALPDPPSYSAVRAMLRYLEGKGVVSHRKAGRRFVYSPRGATGPARLSALRDVLRTFFAGSPVSLAQALFDPALARLSDEEAEELRALVERARRRRR